MPSLPNPDQVSRNSKQTKQVKENESYKKVEYPLKSLNILSAEASYQRGFWQRSRTFPLIKFFDTTESVCREPVSSVESISEWKRRVPYALLIGCQKGGTTAMAYYLYNHPSISYLPSKELVSETTF
jgi:hypothetical protein